MSADHLGFEQTVGVCGERTVVVPDRHFDLSFDLTFHVTNGNVLETLFKGCTNRLASRGQAC
ncbi:hypothetical protein GOB81_09785 [Acetobacter sp. LMG 1627]|uniref:Uncharacterized protein n=1 Tax=Acetobacter conturbans TaxID=1737472 RepID=A0ABX0JZL3_9PROT|nr:hypothetical protein [Acetobacter conturbans]